MRFLALSVFTLLIGFSATAQGQVTFTELDLTNNRIEMVNTSSSNIDLGDWWLCNRSNGDPFYTPLANGAQINSQLSSEATGAVDLILEPGDVLVLDIEAGLLPDDEGEFALYNTASFGSSAAIEEYIAWGANVGIRDTVAQGAGLWTANDFIDISELGANETIQLTFGEDSVESTDYFFDSSTLGTFTDPVVAPVLLGDVDLSGEVNFLDISPFIAILSSGDFQAEADIDENEAVNFLDISPFIAILSGS